jgi:DNA polymerase
MRSFPKLGSRLFIGSGGVSISLVDVVEMLAKPALPHRASEGAVRARIYHGHVSEVSERERRREQLVELFQEASGCTRCPLAEGRTNVVFGAGNADADLMFVGEAPGAEEDRQGLPFVGRAGAILTELLEGIDLTRDEVFIANVLKCHPPGNRDPQPGEIDSCRPYLYRQLELIRPRVVGTLGNFATRLMTGSRAPISKVRGAPQLHSIAGVSVFLMPLFHPAAALRTPSLLDTLREDFAKLPALVDEGPPEMGEGVPAGVVAEPSADQLDLFG